MTTTDLVRPSTASVGIGVLSGAGATALGVFAASPPLVAVDRLGHVGWTPATGGVGLAAAVSGRFQTA